MNVKNFMNLIFTKWKKFPREFTNEQRNRFLQKKYFTTFSFHAELCTRLERSSFISSAALANFRSVILGLHHFSFFCASFNQMYDLHPNLHNSIDAAHFSSFVQKLCSWTYSLRATFHCSKTFLLSAFHSCFHLYSLSSLFI